MQTLTEENYLKAIYKLREGGMSPISTNALAARIGLRPASVTGMLKKLAGKKLISYRKYQGLSLTALGEKVAISIIRKHRLWEMFLAEKLKFPWDEVHELAEQLEHIRSEKLVEKLDAFLDFPETDPHGDPIPDVQGRFKSLGSKPLAGHSRKSRLRMTGVIDHSPAFLRFLDQSQLSLGDEIMIDDITEYDSSLKVTVNNKHKLSLSERAAANILVVPHAKKKA